MSQLSFELNCEADCSLLVSLNCSPISLTMRLGARPRAVQGWIDAALLKRTIALLEAAKLPVTLPNDGKHPPRLCHLRIACSGRSVALLRATAFGVACVPPDGPFVASSRRRHHDKDEVSRPHGSRQEGSQRHANAETHMCSPLLPAACCLLPSPTQGILRCHVSPSHVAVSYLLTE